MTPQIHALADVQSTHIGPNTRICQFAIILKKSEIGADCNICSHVLIENDVIIGDRVTLKSGVQLWDGMRIEDDVFIGPNVTFTNDPFPRSKQYPKEFPVTTVKTGASIGGGGNYPSWHNKRSRCHGRRWRGGDQVGSRWCGCRWQSGSHRALHRGQR